MKTNLITPLIPKPSFISGPVSSPWNSHKKTRRLHWQIQFTRFLTHGHMASAVGLTAFVPAVSSAPSRTTVRISTGPKNASLTCLNNRRMRGVSVRASVQSVDVSKVVPQADRVLVRLEDLPEKSAGGVLLPKAAVKFERYLMGEVLSVGSGVGDGVVEKGKKVLFSDINAYEVNMGTKERHCFCRVGDLMAVVE